MLAVLPNKDNIRKVQTLTFGGINRNTAAGDGTIRNTVNMDTDRMPLLAPRKPRQKLALMPGLQTFGMTAVNGDIFWTAKDGNEVKLYRNGAAIRTGLEENQKSFAVLNGYLIIFPDKKMLNLSELDTRMIFSDDEYMDAAAENVQVLFKDGTINGESAERNTIELQGTHNWADFRFREGDAVQIVTSYGRHDQDPGVADAGGVAERKGQRCHLPATKRPQHGGAERGQRPDGEHERTAGYPEERGTDAGGDGSMQGLLNGRTNLQNASFEQVRETLQELITELSYVTANLSSENFTQNGLKDLKRALEELE